MLDTHVWIWSQERPEQLGRRTAKLLLAPRHVNRVCTISTLEVARLLAAGDITLSMPADDRILAYRDVRSFDARR